MSRWQNDWEELLKNVLWRELAEAGYSGTLLFLFGSRAEGSATSVSDIDIGIKAADPLPFHLLAHLRDKVDALNLPYKVDLVDFHRVSAEFSEQAMKGAIPWTN